MGRKKKNGKKRADQNLLLAITILDLLIHIVRLIEELTS